MERIIKIPIIKKQQQLKQLHHHIIKKKKKKKNCLFSFLMASPMIWLTSMTVILELNNNINMILELEQQH